MIWRPPFFETTLPRLTPPFRGVGFDGGSLGNCFNSFNAMAETVKTVSRGAVGINTPLKRGVNERLTPGARGWRVGARKAAAPKAFGVQDCRTPKPVGVPATRDRAIASWSAAVLCRFGFAADANLFVQISQIEQSRGRNARN
jgi:hypothetical protein